MIEKNRGGRPLKFKSVAELKDKIESYFNQQDPHTEMRRVEAGVRNDGTTNWAVREIMTEQRPYGINGLAYHLNTSRETLNDYASGKYDAQAEDYDETGATFSDAIKQAKARIRMQVEERMLAGEAPATPSIFWLKNNDGWEDQSKVDHTNNGKSFAAYSNLTTEELRKLAAGE